MWYTPCGCGSSLTDDDDDLDTAAAAAAEVIETIMASDMDDLDKIKAITLIVTPIAKNA